MRTVAVVVIPALERINRVVTAFDVIFKVGMVSGYSRINDGDFNGVAGITRGPNKLGVNAVYSPRKRLGRLNRAGLGQRLNYDIVVNS